MDGMMKTVFTLMMARAMLQKSVPPDKVNQDALIAALPAFPGAGGNFISPIVTAQKLAQDEQTIVGLQNKTQASLRISDVVDRLNQALVDGSLKGEVTEDGCDDFKFVNKVFATNFEIADLIKLADAKGDPIKRAIKRIFPH